MIEMQCKRRGGGFLKKRPWHRFCSDECRLEYHAETRKIARQIPSICDELRQAGYQDAAEFLQAKFELKAG